MLLEVYNIVLLNKGDKNMTNPSLYKKVTMSQVETRKTSALSQTEKTQVNQTVAKFFELFIAKHM